MYRIEIKKQKKYCQCHARRAMSCHKTMLRYFYLATLILCCIEWTFSYSYIDDYTGRHIHKYRRAKKSKVGRSKARRNVMRQEYDEDRSPVEFDVASFIRPSEVKEEDNYEQREENENYRLSNSEYNDYRKKKNPNYLHIGGESIELNPLYKESMKTKQRRSYMDESGEQYSHENFRSLDNELNLDYQNPNSVHHPKKKCAFKKIRVPFFFHNKMPDEINHKKIKKKRLFGLSDQLEKNGTLEENNTANLTPSYKIKRSFNRGLCPDCRKKFIAETNPDLQTFPKNQIIHNSRQFYQFFSDARNKINNNKHSGIELDEINTRKRKKRNRAKNEKYFDKVTQRQLNELDEIEKKINSIKDYKNIL